MKDAIAKALTTEMSTLIFIYVVLINGCVN